MTPFVRSQFLFVGASLFPW